jgi:phosphate/sulfate permease
VISPFLSALISYILYSIIQRQILTHPNPLNASRRIAPYFVFLCIFVISLSLNIPLIYAFCASLSFAMFSKLALAPTFATAGNITFSDESVEKMFIPMQILSACLVAFAHGANDVANAIGPVAAVLGVLKTQTITEHSTVPSWLLALGGIGIVLGLATWGWRVIETIGKKITELTPTRGFAAEFGAATTILLASKLGLPISTTHALIGAVLGVGLARGVKELNIQILKEIVVSWIVTIPLCALFSIIAFYLLKLCFI